MLAREGVNSYCPAIVEDFDNSSLISLRRCDVPTRINEAGIDYFPKAAFMRTALSLSLRRDSIRTTSPSSTPILIVEELYHIPVANDRNREFRNSNIAWMIVLKFQWSQMTACVADVCRNP
jgi:hypothetical protein